MNDNSGISRRRFIKGVGGGVVSTAAMGAAGAEAAASRLAPKVIGPDRVAVSFTVNGKLHELKLDPRVSLLDALRDHLSYTGTKRVCNRGQCGACTVILNGRTVLACQMFAFDADGAEIETIEGLAEGDQLHAVQAQFVKHDAIQCGFCTSGFVMSSVALLRENPSPSSEQIRAGVSGNICRCGTYPNIFKAVEEAAKSMKKGG